MEVAFCFLAFELNSFLLKIHIPPAKVTCLCLADGCGAEELNKISALRPMRIEFVGTHVSNDLVELIQ